MIVSRIPKRSNTCWLQACALLCVLLVRPLGIAAAQDHKAVERRLGEAVANGELSLEQAGAMMDALRKASGAKKQAAKTKSDTDLESAWQKLQAMVKAGELTQEQATAKMSAIKKEATAKKQDSDRAEVSPMKVKKELGDAVGVGKINKEGAAKKFEATQKRIKEKTATGSAKPGSKRITREGYTRAEAELQKAVAQGKMSKEDLRTRLNLMRNTPGRKDEAVAKKGTGKRISLEDFARAEAKIRKAIAEHKITEQQGRAKLAAMRKMIGDKSEGPAKKRTDWEGIKKQIEGAVESGKITREQADAKYKVIRDRQDRKVKEKDANDKGAD